MRGIDARQTGLGQKRSSANVCFRLLTDLRSAKLKCQLIIASHNANLPVNAEAELIYALEARDGHGQALAQGGLDRAHLADAVLDIMKGSEQAFKQGSEKYHF